MPCPHTAIVHLRQPSGPATRAVVEPRLRLVSGIDSVAYEAAESMITVEFDAERTGLGDIVRIVEDLGLAVSGVAQRRMSERMRIA